MFITAFTSARHLFLSWTRSIQSIPPHPISWRFILILSYHLRLGLPSGFFPSGFHTKTLYRHLLSPPTHMLHAHLILLEFIARTIVAEEYRSLQFMIPNWNMFQWLWFPYITEYWGTLLVVYFYLPFAHVGRASFIRNIRKFNPALTSDPVDMGLEQVFCQNYGTGPGGVVRLGASRTAVLGSRI